MEIRRLTEEDVEVFWPVRLRALREEPDAFGSDYEESSRRPVARAAERLRKKGEDDYDFTLGAIENGVLVGTIGLHRDESPKEQHKAMVWGMYVAPEVRGRGVGRALMEETIRRAHQVPGLLQIYLLVIVTKTAARNLYRSVGFEVYGVEPRSLKIGDRYLDGELMVLKLD